MCDRERTDAQLLQSIRRYFRRDARMTVAIASHPGAKADSRQGARFSQFRGIKASVDPCLTQTFIERWEDVWEDLSEVMQNVAPLIGQSRFLQENFACSPKALEGSLCGFPQSTFFGGSKIFPIVLLEQAEEGAVLIENGEAFRLGRVSRQHRFHPYLPHGFENRF